MCYICPINHPFAPKGVQLSLVRLTKAFFGWIPSNCWIFHHSSSFLMTLGPSLSAFVSFLSYHWLINVATSFVNGPQVVCVFFESAISLLLREFYPSIINYSCLWSYVNCCGITKWNLETFRPNICYFFWMVKGY